MFIAETVTQEQKEYRWKNTVKAVVATRQMLKLSLLGTGGLTVTCKDCLYHHICKIIDVLGEIQGNAECCLQFKDRSRFVELPCKLGDTVYYFNSAGEIFSQKVSGFIVNFVGILVDSDVMFDSHLMGDRFFSTREEAEQALKERENNAN